VDIGWFCESCYGVVAFKGDFNISVFKQVGDFAYVWGCKCEGCLLCVISSVCGGVACIILCFIWCFSLWSRVAGNLLFFAMWRMVCHSLCSWSFLRGRLNILSL